MPLLGVFGNMYHRGYGYAPYGAYPALGSTVPTVGHDGQPYGPQHYHYPAQLYQPPTSASNQVPTSQGDVSTSASADQPPISVDKTKANSNGISNGNSEATAAKPGQQIASLTSSGMHGRGVLPGVLPSCGFQDARFGFDAMRSPIPWFDAPVYPDVQQRPATTNSASSAASQISSNTSARNQSHHLLLHPMGMHAPRSTSLMGPATPAIMNRMYPNNRMYGQFSNLGFNSNVYDSRTNGRWGVAVDGVYKPRGQRNGFFSYGNENFNGLSELNRGPRAGRFKNQKWFGPTITAAVKGQSLPTNGNVKDASLVPDKVQYYRADIPETPSDAKFFVIKSYSEDDVHKSVKYNVWASTPNGNKKLDAAYQEAKEKSDGCPVFLFFSVNTSGQFVGVAEMVGPVDFNKTMDYWQHDKWNGCFPVKWHIVKDVPNGILKHIKLENNDNKPMTNSRDTQEVKLEEGLQMLKLFKDHTSKTSILDDFTFYELRQKVMQESKAKQQLQKKAVDGLPGPGYVENSKDGTNWKPRIQKPLVIVLEKGSVQGELKPSEKNDVPAVRSVNPKDATPVTEEQAKSSIGNGC